MTLKKINYNSPIISDNPKFSVQEIFDDYFFIHGKKYRVVESLGDNSYLVKSEKVKSNITLNIVKAISYCTGIIPLIMWIGQMIAKSQYDFYKQNRMGETVSRNFEILASPTRIIEPAKEDKRAEDSNKNEDAASFQSEIIANFANSIRQDNIAQLKQAFIDEKPAVCAWLIQEKGASLKEFEAYTQTIQMSKSQEELLSWLKIVSEKSQATPENLDHFALTLGLGYKSANLLVMEQKAEAMSKNLKTATIKVPPFLPVGDFEMTQYIQKSIPEVFEKWEAFLETSFDFTAKQEFLDAESNEKASKTGLKITKEGEAILEEIKEMIIDHFTENPYHSPQMADWLNKVDPLFLIIRSTGKEDSDTNSNAGGNASIPYVIPDEESISIAIGEVIASYFGEKSINQRILCGDRSLFTDDKPFVPILMQEMVGESLDGIGSKNEDIPRSGVLFTRQDDKANGVTLIQTGLGNNEGVVSSQVSVDSYFVKEDKVHAVVRNKETRFVSVQNPDDTISLNPIKNNNPKLEMSQALPNSIILDLKRVADDISITYAKEKGGMKPMDMEYTVKLKEKGSVKPVIYLLQARPLMNTKGEEKIEHTYLDLKELKKESQENVFSSEVLLDGNAYVRRITDPKSVIFADDLPKGANIYLHASDPTSKKVIFLKKTAPATSHESVILRPKGVAVVVVSDPGQFAALKKRVQESSENSPLLVDTQRGIAVSCTSKEAPDHMIKKGLVSYPIPLEASIPPSKIMQQFLKFGKDDEDAAKALIENFEKEAEALIEDLKGNKDLLIGVNTRELLDIMATKEEQEAKLALATLLKRLKNRLAMSMKNTEDFRKKINQPMFQLFEAALDSCQKEIVPALEQYPAESLERLYPIKFLDAMIHQKMNPDVMNNPSYYQVLALDLSQKKAMEEATKIGIKYDGPNGLKLISLHKLSGQAYNETCQSNWLSLVGELSKINSQQAKDFISRLLPIVSQVSDLNIADKWLNVKFNQVWNKHSGKDSIAKLEAIIEELEKAHADNQNTLSWIHERIGALAIAKQGTPNWADPAFAKKQASKLKKSFTKDLGFDKTGSSQGSIKQIYETSDDFGKLALLQYIRDAVNTYDCIIKAAKESSSFADDQAKACQVAELLEGYLEMMEATFTLIPAADQHDLMETAEPSPVLLFDPYVQKLKEGGIYNFGFKNKHQTIGFNNLAEQLKTNSVDASIQLEARPEFTVDAMIVGSKVDMNFSVHWPNRLEEYFTTFHQNMEQIVKLLNTKHGLNSDLLSDAAKGLCDKSSSKFRQNISYLTMEDGKLNVGYQIPLRQHAANFAISYDPKKPESGLDLKIQMFGNDENNRWDWAACFGSVLAYTMANGFVDDIPPQVDYSKPGGVAFTLKIPPNFKDEDKLINALYYLTLDLTMDQDGEPETLLEHMQKGEAGYAGSIIYEGLGTIDWENLNPDCFKYTLHINKTLIDMFSNEGKEEAAARVAINSLRGIAYYGIKDYTRAPGLSLAKRSILELKSLIPKLPSIHAELQELVDDPDMQGIPMMSQLKSELAKAKKIDKLTFPALLLSL